MYLYEKYMLQETDKAEKRGEKRGMEKTQEEYIEKMLRKGKTVEEIVFLLDIPEKTVLKIQKNMETVS